MRTNTVRKFVCFIFGVSLIFLLTACSNDDTNRSQSSSQSNDSQLTEYKLACLNKGTSVSKNDPTVEEFRLILNRLDRECPESRSLIGDMIYKAWSMYKEDTGRNPSLLWIAQQLNESVPSGSNKALKFAEIAGAWLTLVGN